ncbi:MAG: ATP-binding protein [Bacteroidetes bacterium]|nr:MAG: ATP-binding protein [Bacteroidota bacterium]
MTRSNADTPSTLCRNLTLASTPNVIHLVETVVDEIRTEFQFKDDVYGNVMVAVTEAVNNSIHHGNKGDETKKVYIDFEMKNPYRLLVRVRDEGDGFDPSSLDDPTAPENVGKIGGRGVFLMTHLSDELIFAEDGRQVEMIFNI